MSTSTPPPTTASNNDNFIVDLLLGQQDLSAVEAFSEFHDSESRYGTGDDDVSPAQAKYYSELIPLSKPGAGQQYAFQVDLDTCSGCKACVVACHTLNGLEEEETWRSVGLLAPSEPADDSRLYHVTTACHHCVDPGCLKGCPVKAYDKDPETGIVRHLDDQCIGCQYCTMMCPYDVPQYSKSKGIVRKCDMCHQRLAVGEAPACVQACPNEAISIRVVDQQSAKEKCQVEGAALTPQAPDSSITLPTTVYKSKHSVLSDTQPQDAFIDSPAHSHWPLAVMLVLSQLSVGIVVLERILSASGSASSSQSRALITSAAIIGIVGIHVALLHLGRPHVAFRAFLGLMTSWMSREIVVFGAYMGAISTAAGFMWLPDAKDYLPALLSEAAWFAKLPELSGAATTGAVVTGLLGVFCSGMIYVATQRELWRPSRTMTRFYASMIILGSAAVGIGFAASETPLGAVALLMVSVAGMILKLNWESQFLLSPPPHEPQTFDDRARTIAYRDLGPLVRLRVFAALAAIAIVSVSVLVLLIGSSSPAIYLAASGLLAMVIGEVAERLLYFMSVVYNRMPGALR